MLPIDLVTDRPGPGGSHAGIQIRLGFPRIDPPLVVILLDSYLSVGLWSVVIGYTDHLISFTPKIALVSPMCAVTITFPLSNITVAQEPES